MLTRRIQVHGARVLIMGLAFKENCPDLRNTRIVDLVEELQEYGALVDIHDPWVTAEDAEREYGLRLIESPERSTYDGIILAVAHDEFRTLGAQHIRTLGKNKHVLYDLKYIFRSEDTDIRL